MPRGSIGSPPERGAGAHAVWSGHVLAPDPRLALIKAWVFFTLESRDPTVSSPAPPEGSGTHPGGLVCTCGGLEPRPEVRAVHPGVRHFPVGVRTHCHHLGVYRLLWPHGGPGAAHVEGSGAVHHATRDSRAGTVSPHCSKGYPCPRVLTVAPGTASGEETSLQVGPKLDCRLARRFRAFAVVITASPPLVTLTTTPVPAAD
jgi:hypothetical protein